jgi:hypothetical protein
MAGVGYRIDGIPGVEEMLAQFSGQKLQNVMRRAVRAGAKPFQAGLKSAAASEPTGNVPESFQKVPAAKVSTHGGVTGREIEARVRPKSPLFNIFEPGAGGHVIEPGTGALAGPAGSGAWDAKGRKRGRAFFSRKRVWHPGMAARPLIPTAFESKKDEASDAVADALFVGAH